MKLMKNKKGWEMEELGKTIMIIVIIVILIISAIILKQKGINAIEYIARLLRFK